MAKRMLRKKSAAQSVVQVRANAAKRRWLRSTTIGTSTDAHIVRDVSVREDCSGRARALLFFSLRLAHMYLRHHAVDARYAMLCIGKFSYFNKKAAWKVRHTGPRPEEGLRPDRLSERR